MTTLNERQLITLRHVTDAVSRSHAGLNTGLVVGAAPSPFKRLTNGEVLVVARLYVTESRLDLLVRHGYLRVVGACRGPRGGLHRVYRPDTTHPFWRE